MCIICSKAKGVDMPSKETINNMWTRNPDGAGFMYAVDGKVKIRKGFMTLDALEEALAEAEKEVNLKDTGVVLHFRITTHGGTCAENTHPFAITDNIKRLQKTSVNTDVGVAHNGIIDISPRYKNISDTMEYIASVLAPLKRSRHDFYTDHNLLDLITNTINNSRMCFLDGNGDIVTVGNWVECDGIKYSNSSYTSYTKYRHYSNYIYNCSLDDEYDDVPWYETTKTKSSTKTSKKSDKKTDKKKSKGAKLITRLTHKRLMFLFMSDYDAYVTDENNNALMGDEYAIDKDDNVYVYDPLLDACTECPNYNAWRSDGSRMQFNDDFADTEAIMTIE